MKKVLLWLLKVSLSALIACVVLTGFCMLYYNEPIHDDTADGVTDYSWEYNKFYSRGTEGFAWGKTNNEGYTNTYDYSENKDVDVLVMGSSHMEARQVAMEESTAAVLGSLLSDQTVYNIGVSSHNFLVCADNIAAAVHKYNPSKYVVLETSSLEYTDEELLSAINETVPDLTSNAHGVLGLLQKNQFLRLSYTQLKDLNEHAKATANADNATATQTMGSEELYDQLFAKLADDVSQSGAQLIIAYHCRLVLNEDGSATASHDEELRSFFADVCNRNGVIFLDMSDIFVENYEQNRVLPHGFTNSSVGSGHLNKHGHAMMANAIYDLIKEEK